MFAARASGLVKLLGLCLTAGVLLAAMVFPFVGGLGLASNRAADTVDQTSGDLAKGELPLVTTIQDMNGDPIAYLYDQYRIPLETKDIADTMKGAILAIEDKRFYEHQGVDWQGIARAAAKAGVDGGATQGASTLTQQYVKNYMAFVLGADNEQEAWEKATEATVGRKMREARVALQLEQQMTKDEILTGYLNIVPLGNQTYGVGAAAKAYFNTTADKLTVPQAALLAAIANRPSSLNPGASPEKALERRNIVIDKMRENGAFGADETEARKKAEEFKAEPMGIVENLQILPKGCVGAGDGPIYGFFCSYLLDYLRASGITNKQLQRGGLTIKTTMDPKATKAAKQSAEQQVPKTQNGIANVMSVVQPGTDKHRVRALVASRDYGNKAELGQVARPVPAEVLPFGPGSVNKIFTAAAAMKNGVTGIDRKIKVPKVYNSRVYPNGGSAWRVQNAGDYPEEMTLTQALATSPNTGFVILQEQAGLNNVVDMAYKLGMRETLSGVNRGAEPLKSDGSNGPSQGDWTKQNNAGSYTLGPGATSVLELANVAATIVSSGTWCPPTPVEKVIDRYGKDVPLKEMPCEQAVEPDLANSLAQGMSHDTTGSGTAAAAASGSGWNRPAIGKTGTTEEHKSVAFLAATPQYAGAVMTYADGNNPQVICANPIRLCPGSSQGVFGGQVAAPTWFNAMKVIHEGLPVAPLPPAAPRYK
ncbi:Membrane carboxypeptidase (penicillin-binding protein) [Lentzea albidocapillata subsp. violacea]|uniref:Membrane carboxypeptidase (Penicillin-binding protein) n=1 Tax=Lentzea albidocapillata subsp. violacea TaxID=128104 RepID=A0A1G9PS98_9PSEU|nr:transglycosylase domain-containing protein [Lentzea albidocapillata]SDM01672.1 Membrane carboxypeptidase (penicillin-binding protein) [Lentzea albidocapillata subsp. violacea]